MCNFLTNIDVFYKKLQNTYSRYLSWEHCYLYFYKNFHHKQSKDFDLAALNLAFYLASWGMYRGSSFLLQYDYKIHIGLLKKLLVNNYNSLWEYPTKESRELIDKARKEIQQYYSNNTYTKSTTKTLETKILMGIFGCTPAYDRFFTAGLKYYKKNEQCDNKDDWSLFIQILNKHKDKFKNYNLIVDNKLEYPPMKLIDMLFWQIGNFLNYKAIKIDKKRKIIKLLKETTNESGYIKTEDLKRELLDTPLSQYTIK